MKEVWTKKDASFRGKYVELRRRVERAEAGAEAAPADPDRRELSARRSTRVAEIRRRLDADHGLDAT